MKKRVLSSGFSIKKSTIPHAGLGLFSLRRMIKGESLVVKGIWIKRNSQEDLCTRYADPYKFRVRTDLLIPTGYAGLVNHSATPNLKKVVVGKKLYLRALRTIVAGEELSFTYSRYAQGQFKQPRND